MFFGGLVFNYPIIWSNLYSRLFFIVICFSFCACREFLGCDHFYDSDIYAQWKNMDMEVFVHGSVSHDILQ
jgi:hypothetical protein